MFTQFRPEPQTTLTVTAGDVYKRQDLRTDLCGITVDCLTAAEHDVLGADTDPVSYTHLDVYKRQLHSRSRYRFSAYTTLPYPIHYWIA